jgi:hypothetical protein
VYKQTWPFPFTTHNSIFAHAREECKRGWYRDQGEGTKTMTDDELCLMAGGGC